MRFVVRSVLGFALIVAATHSLPAGGDDADVDALSLESAPVESIESTLTKKVFVEAVVGIADQRYELGSRNLRRGSIDFFYAAQLAPGWRGVISDRLDSIHPADIGTDAVVNSLREAYLSWQQPGGGIVGEFGRINLRYGPAYGYNPTDFFRDDTLRTATTVNPLSLRENRLGTVVLRGQRLWPEGSLSIAFSPKLANTPSTHGRSFDLGATNNRDRTLMVLSTNLSQRINSQVLLYKASGMQAQLGANMTALLTDSVVAYGEWSRGRGPGLPNHALVPAEQETTRNRFAGGITHTTSHKLSVTAEYQYNGFALSQESLNTTGGGTSALGAYFRQAQRRQDLASRRAYMIYATQESVALNNLDLTAFIRQNADDHSRLGWVEFRYHWSHFDLAVQLQQQSGNSTSEYGLLPYRRSAQILAAYYLE